MSQSSPLIVAVKNPKNIRYLAFEGGGGKGAAYLGAIEELERNGVLPSKSELSPSGSEQIKGFSGSSAGALTAFLLCIGHSSSNIRKMVMDKKALQALYEDPEPGMLRGIRGNKYLEMVAPNILPHSALYPAGSARHMHQTIKRRKNWPGFKMSAAQAGLTTKIFNFLEDSSNREFSEMVGPKLRKILKDIEKSKGTNKYLLDLNAADDELQNYIYSLFYDRGVMPGFGLRSFIKEKLNIFLLEVPGKSELAETLTFAQLQEITKRELVVTGVNLTHGRPAFFSSKDTPNFPVVDAVAISMSFPMMFKPTWVARSRQVLSGYWADGGILNNLPLHAFDSRNGILLDRGSLTNPGTLALRLDQSNPLGPEILRNPEQLFGKNGKSVELFTVISMYLSEFLSALMYPSEGGQIMSAEDRAQTVSLPTKGTIKKFEWELSTVKFVYPKKVIDAATASSRKCMHSYFGKFAAKR